jgi:hypothetical protein
MNKSKKRTQSTISKFRHRRRQQEFPGSAGRVVGRYGKAADQKLTGSYVYASHKRLADLQELKSTDPADEYKDICEVITPLLTIRFGRAVVVCFVSSKSSSDGGAGCQRGIDASAAT